MIALLKNKAGFGIVEVLVSAVVLGFLLTALLNLQSSNREMLLRLRSRDGAVDVAQTIIDSLNRSGLSSFGNEVDTTLTFCREDYSCGTVNETSGAFEENASLQKFMSRKWDGQPGLVKNTMMVKYRANVKVSKNSDYTAESRSLYAESPIQHVYAKKVDVEVFWKFKGTEHSINVSGIVK